MKCPFKSNMQSENVSPADFVAGAPRFWRGAAALRQHIVAMAHAFLANVPEKFTADGAKESGKEDGEHSDADQFPFQNDCHDEYGKVANNTGRTIGEIVADERERVRAGVDEELPDMKQRIRQRVDRRWASNHLDCSKKLRNRNRDRNRFLSERGLPADGPMTIHGEYGWKFWLPLLVFVVLEFYFNYLLLEGAVFRQKLVIALASVALVLGGGFSVSWFLKADRSVVKRRNRMALVQKILYKVGVVCVSIAFAVILLAFIYYRAGINPLDSESFAGGLKEAFSAPVTDFVLALFNILFFGVTIVTFNKAGWPIHGYGKVHAQQQSAKIAYEGSHNAADNAAKEVFDAAHAGVKQRREDVRLVLQNWETVCATFDAISGIARTVFETIETRYAEAINSYRDAFATGRQDETDADLAHNPVPAEIRKSAPVAPLNPIQPHDGINFDDYRNKAEAFEKAADDWVKENSDLASLQNFLAARKTEVRDLVQREQTDDMQHAAVAEKENGFGNA